MNATVTRWGAMLRCYDNGGRSFDRYTILPPRTAGDDYRETHPGTWQAIAASAHPFAPQGFGQTCSAAPGAHLGRRVRFDALPDDVQRFARQAFPEWAPPAAGGLRFPALETRERWTLARARGTVVPCRFEIRYRGQWRRLYSDRASTPPHFITADRERVPVVEVAP